ncbi:unnamed protein product, partial [Bubo scandiacus]
NQVHISSTLPGIVFHILGPRLIAFPAALLIGARNGTGDYGHGAGKGGQDTGIGAHLDKPSGCCPDLTEKGQMRYPASACKPSFQLLMQPGPGICGA